jgi:hypothetical protein
MLVKNLLATCPFSISFSLALNALIVPTIHLSSMEPVGNTVRKVTMLQEKMSVLIVVMGIIGMELPV